MNAQHKQASAQRQPARHTKARSDHFQHGRRPGKPWNDQEEETQRCDRDAFFLQCVECTVLALIGSGAGHLLFPVIANHYECGLNLV